MHVVGCGHDDSSMVLTKHIFLGGSGIALTFLNLLGVRGPSLLYVEASSFAKTQKVLGYVDKELGHGPSG